MTTRATLTEIKGLTHAARAEAVTCGEWLRTRARFEPLPETSGEYDVCVDNDRLVEISENFMNHFRSSLKDASLIDEIRITAIRFNRRATVPMKPGSYVDLIPVYVIAGSPSISNQPLGVGQYVHLEEEAQVEPEFICLLLMSR